MTHIVMKRPIVIIAMFAALCAPLFAETVKLKILDIQSVTNSLLALDRGIEKPISQGKDQPDKIITVPFTFSGVVRWALYRDAITLKAQLDGFEQTRVTLIKQVTKGGDSIDPKTQPEAFASFTSLITPVADRKMDVEIIKVTQDDLNLKENPIPTSVLMALDPIISK